MELRETIESINERLLNEFGVELNAGGVPRFRVVFSDDEYEKRLTEFTDEGFQLLRPEVRLLPKYKQWIRGKFVLEVLVPIDSSNTDLTTKVSYEPLWVFQDKNGNYLPPFFEGCKHIIIQREERMGKSPYVKYKDPNFSPEERKAEIERVEEQLFGNETDLTDDLHSGSGIVVPEMKTIH